MAGGGIDWLVIAIGGVILAGGALWFYTANDISTVLKDAFDEAFGDVAELHDEAKAPGGSVTGGGGKSDNLAPRRSRRHGGVTNR